MTIILQYRASAGFRVQISAVFGNAVTIIDESVEAAFMSAMPVAEVLLHVL